MLRDWPAATHVIWQQGNFFFLRGIEKHENRKLHPAARCAGWLQ
jgi:hypothetical protein